MKMQKWRLAPQSESRWQRLLVLCGFITFILLVKENGNSDARGRTITTSLKPSDVCDLICAFMYPAMRTVHGDKWKLATTAEFDMWLNNDGMLTDYGITKWQMLVSHIANAIDHVGYGDAKH